MKLLLLWERLVVFCLPVSFEYILPFLFHKGSLNLGQRPAICCIKHTAHSFRILCLVTRVRIQVYFRPEQHNPPEAVEFSLSNCEQHMLFWLLMQPSPSLQVKELSSRYNSGGPINWFHLAFCLFAGRALVCISYLTQSNVGLIIIIFFLYHVASVTIQ